MDFSKALKRRQKGAAVHTTEINIAKILRYLRPKTKFQIFELNQMGSLASVVSCRVGRVR